MSDKKAKSGQMVSSSSEQARRQRAERRVNYGNKLSNMNLNRMRNRQSTSQINPSVSAVNPEPFMLSVAAVPLALTEEPGPHQLKVLMPPKAKREPSEDGVLLPSASESKSLRRIASSFAHVCETDMGCGQALPNEDNEEDAREERAEVLIKSEVMPVRPSAPLSQPILSSQKQLPLLPSAAFTPTSLSPLPVSLEKSGKDANDDDDIDLSDPIVETRATERWHQLGNTVSALFRTRRCNNIQESPMARLRRVREQRELLEAFTRPFLYEAMKRE